jgi:regulatory protein
VAEVRARLEREDGVSAENIQMVIDELVGYGYLDDARYARVFAQDRRTLDQWGTERIARTLRGRGVGRDLVESAVQQLADDAPESELERARALLTQRFPLGPAEPRDRDRAFGVLVRKGYESEIAADAVRAWARGDD